MRVHVLFVRVPFTDHPCTVFYRSSLSGIEVCVEGWSSLSRGSRWRLLLHVMGILLGEPYKHVSVSVHVQFIRVPFVDCSSSSFSQVEGFIEGRSSLWRVTPGILLVEGILSCPLFVQSSRVNTRRTEQGDLKEHVSRDHFVDRTYNKCAVKRQPNTVHGNPYNPFLCGGEIEDFFIFTVRCIWLLHVVIILIKHTCQIAFESHFHFLSSHAFQQVSWRLDKQIKS